MKNQARAMFSDEERQMNNKPDVAHQIKNVCNSMNSDLAETDYCDYSNAEIKKVARTFLKFKKNERELVTKLFLFVRDDIIFGGDRWRVKASETLNKGYGACYNKNLLLVALLRYHGIPSQLCANPMSKNFNKPAIGYGYITMSTPFFHCFTKVLVDKKWVDIDPTLDKTTYDTFFAPLNIDWSVDWDGHSNMRLYNKVSFRQACMNRPKNPGRMGYLNLFRRITHDRRKRKSEAHPRKSARPVCHLAKNPEKARIHPGKIMECRHITF